MLRRLSLIFLSICWIPSVVFSQIDIYEAQELEIIAAEKRFAEIGIQKAVLPKANSGNYDIKFNRLDLEVNPAVHFIQGEITTYFEPTSAISTMEFDLSANMTVQQVMHQGQSLPFVLQTDDVLTITFPSALSPQVLDSVKVTYSGAPTTNN
ncbi:MAG: hypothetical protein RQ756_04095, partial [Flavobacteriaceae bacterium]|nr:hypothetical protein [Flavobacteriaceae bacterium]